MKLFNEQEKPVPFRLRYPMKEAAQLLGISLRKLHDLAVTKGRIDSIKDGRQRFISHETLTEYVHGKIKRAV